MAQPLARYRKMRDFTRTPEPRGGRRRAAADTQQRLGFYIQRHNARRLHYDFRLELDGVLKSWAVPKGPSLDPSERRLAVQTEDHPLEYGSFEGMIPEHQYGAGEVLLWDQGTWVPEDPDPRVALERGRLHFQLHGEKLHGSWTLTRMRHDDDKPQWLLIKRDDDEAHTGEDAEVTLRAPQSVKRARKRAARPTKSALPQFLAPQLATLVTEPPAAGDWIYEVKHDGYRMLARLADGRVGLFTRAGKDWTDKLPRLAAALKQLGIANSWLDGEIVVQRPDGRASFQALQNAFEAGGDAAMVYFVFDAPYLRGRDLTRLPLRERKRRLAAALAKRPQPAIRLSEHLEGSAKEILSRACELGLEGLIGKQGGSVYASGRSRSWIKLKCRQRQDFVIVGYTQPGGSRQGFGALVLGFHDAAGKLRLAGKVGTGFDDATLASLMRRMASLKRPASPIAEVPRDLARSTQWLRPVLVAEVAYAERTDDGLLRQASFLGLREDLPARAVGEEHAEPPPQPTAPGGASGDQVAGVRITHPDRIIWSEPRITKLELARYYAEVGEWLLPHVANRPLTMVRCPDGAEGECFFQRHLAMGTSPGDVLTFKRERSTKGHYIFVNTQKAVISVVQNGAIELHTWGATVPDVSHPDRITIDLDPGPELAWAKLREATMLTRRLLEGLGLRCFVKTTGGKGLHVVSPLQREHGWREVKEFASQIAAVLARAEPGLFTASIAKKHRTGRVFVDYLRNAETASAVAAYSARARPGAPVSVPLDWGELGAEDLRERFNIRNVPKRLARLGADPWSGYAESARALTPKMRDALKKAAGRS